MNGCADSFPTNYGAAIFPDPSNALPDGLLAYGGDLEPATLVSAYSQGIFPWYSKGDPILWWAPDPRCVLLPDKFHISARSARKIRNSGFLASIDLAFGQVVEACSLPRKEGGGTWLLPEMKKAYCRLFDMGLAHSFEIWQRGTLVGGVYGVALGAAFFGESMFRRVDEASRAALCCLIHTMRLQKFLFLDCQIESPHMLAMGAANIPRKDFLQLLKQAPSKEHCHIQKQDMGQLPDCQEFKS